MYRPVNPREILERRNIINELKYSIECPSFIHTESLTTEYLKKWFLSHFQQKYFKTVYVNESHILSEFSHLKDSISFIKNEKPAIAFIPQIDFAFNDDDHQLNLYGNQNYIINSDLNMSFFKDYKHNVFIKYALELVQIAYDIRIIVNTRAQQVDLYKYLMTAFPFKATTAQRIDLDFHIPTGIMKQLASDVGFNLDSNDFNENVNFLKYLNSNSELPIMYKFRGINGKYEYFARVNNLYIKFDLTDGLSVDNGEQEGMTFTNFSIGTTITAQILAPSMFIYYSEHPHDVLAAYRNNDPNSPDIAAKTSIPIIDLPKVNEKGWNLYLTSNYIHEQGDSGKIDYNELFENINISSIIKKSIKCGISPRNFIDIKTFNGENEYPTQMDWETCIGSYDTNMISEKSVIALYLDTEYIHDQNVQAENMMKNRIVVTDKSNE